MLTHKPPSATSQLDAMLQAFPDALFTMDEEGTILDYRGGKGVSTLFVSPHGLVGRKAMEVLPPDFARQLGAGLQELRATHGPASFEYASEQAGLRRWFEARLVRASRGHVVMVVRDITRRREAEEKVDSHERRMRSLQTIDRTISSSRDLRLTLSVIMSQVAAELSVDAADILLLNAESRLEFAAGVGFHSDARQKKPLPSREGLAAAVVASGRMVHVADLGRREDGTITAPELQEEGFRSYFGLPLTVRGKVRGVLEVFYRRPSDPDEEWHSFLEALAGQAAIAIENAALVTELQQTHFELTLAYDTTLEGWARALDLRDRDTEGHTRRVTEATVQLGRRLGLGEAELVYLRRGAMLHDIGKMAIPDSILFKEGPLSEAEKEELRRHPRYAYELLSPIPYLAQAVDIPHYHHERWDGTGYPDGLKGKEIPLAARLFAVVDVFDALTMPRPYRPGWEAKRARAYIEQEAGKQFDPDIAAEFIRMLDAGEAGDLAWPKEKAPEQE